MLTPTGVTSSAYWDAIKAGNPTHVRMIFTGQNVILTDEHISYTEGLQIDDMFNGDTDLVFGKAICKQVTVGIIKSDILNGLNWSGEFYLEMGVEISGVTNWVTVGIFAGEKPSNVTNVPVIQFIAYDRMTKFDVLADKFLGSVSYPITLANFYNALCSYVGVTKVSGNELSNIMNRSFASAPADMSGYTCRDVLAFIAEACGCYAKITADGECKMAWYTDNTNHVLTGDEEFSAMSSDITNGLTWNEADQLTWNTIDTMLWDDVSGTAEGYRVDQLLIKQLDVDLDVSYPDGTGENVYLIAQNPFLSISTASDINSYIVPLYNRMQQFGGYIPAEITCIGNWLVEAGDIITADIAGNTITFPVFVKTMRWNGAARDAYETTGQKQRELYANAMQKQKVISNSRIDLYVTELRDEMDGDLNNLKNDVDSNYYKIQSGISIVPQGITISGSKYINIESGSQINIKSGGYFAVETGGDVDIQGSSVAIRSGSTFDVDATNFSISSVNKRVKTGSWEITENGMIDTWVQASTNKKALFTTGNEFNDYIYSTEGKAADVIFYNATPFSNGRGVVVFGTSKAGSDNIDLQFPISFEKTSTPPQIIVGSSVSDNQNRIFSYAQRVLPQTDDPDGYYSYLGTSDNKWKYAYIETLYQGSSRDIKHDIQPMEEQGDAIDELRPVTFIYDDDAEQKKRYGLIYEDTVGVMPDICSCDEGGKAINYLELVPILLKEIQSLRNRIADLERR